MLRKLSINSISSDEYCYEKPTSGEHSPYPQEQELLIFDDTIDLEENSKLPKSRKRSLDDGGTDYIFQTIVPEKEKEKIKIKKKRSKSVYQIEERKKEFDIKKYYLNLESIYLDKEIQYCFQKYINNESNEELKNYWSFLEQVQNYENLIKSKNENEIMKLYQNIYDNYLKNNILNFSLNELEVFESSNNIEFHLKYFKKQIEFKIYQDIFPRFIRTKKCFEILKKNINCTKICNLIQNYYYPYTDDDFKISIITDFDISFFKNLTNDNFEWELIDFDSNLNSNTFFSKTNFLPNVSFFKNSSTLKFESYLSNCSFENSILSLGNQYNMLNTLLQLSNNEYLIENKKELNYWNFEYLQNHYQNMVSNFKRGNNQINLSFKNYKLNLTSTCFFEDENNWICIVRPFHQFEEDEQEQVHVGTDVDKSTCVGLSMGVNNSLNVNNKLDNDKKYEMNHFIKFQFTRITESIIKYTYIHSLIQYINHFFSS
eukprot:gene12411-6078_t